VSEWTNPADRAGILPGYERAGGGWCETSQETRERLLALLGDAPFADGARGPDSPPTPCVSYLERIGSEQALGLWINLYTLRGSEDFGVGNFSHLVDLARWAGPLGIDFIGLSPLHALRNRPPEISPYSPTSRLFLNPIYVDPLAAPEYERADALRRHLGDPAVLAALQSLRASDRVDYAHTSRVLAPIFDQLFAQFERDRAAGVGDRSKRFADFVTRGGSLLRDFASFVCLEQHLCEPDWTRWPDEFQSPNAPGLAAFRRDHQEELERVQFLQFEAECQLAAAQEAALQSGMRIGLYRDLALSSLKHSFDAWAFPDLFVTDVRLGAPPDGYAAGGQDWSLPALDPRRLAGPDPHPYFEALLDTNLRHAGALRIDHVMGLFRQYWIPEGMPASQGGYVRFPGLDLFDHIGRASQAHRALIVGEDLGTVPSELPALMDRAQMLSCKVFFFERDEAGEFRMPHEYLDRALVTATTHDFPTLLGYVRGGDLEIQHELGLLTRDELARAREDRERDVERLRSYLARLGIEAPEASATREVSLRWARAIYLALRQCSSVLLGLGLDNLAQELEPVNVPGASVDAYPSWTRRMRRSVRELVSAPEIRELLTEIRRARRDAPPTPGNP